jgi:alpha-1,3-glucosyltransferase
MLMISSFAFVYVVRIMIGYQPHSGQDNYHGGSSIIRDTVNGAVPTTTNSAPYGGDYEAQRHWMEITLHLPISQWYYYDVQYWGLDYPPLTAYHSYVCGFICHFVMNLPNGVDFYTSRGYEDPIHKAYMRSTVLISDLLFYGTIIWIYATSRTTGTIQYRKNQQQHNANSSIVALWGFIYPMLQPAIILIDHGHFQYNTVALGLSLWSFYYLTKPPSLSVNNNYTNTTLSDMYYCLIGSFLFVCALSFKQMTLYYAPAIFFYLLGRCFENDNENVSAARFFSKATYRISLLGITVITTFIALWWPFIVYGPMDTTYMDRFVHMLRRIIPLQRGLFEGKVSNIWCALSVKPFNIRQRIPAHMQPMAALTLTLILIAPCCYHLFQVGRGTTKYSRSDGSKGSRRDWSYDRHHLLWGTTNCALAFFLASFQVHEKSLLIALAPCSILAATATFSNGSPVGSTDLNIRLYHDPTFVQWFSIVAVWSLWPLLQLDRLQTAYFCMILLFCSIYRLQRELHSGTGSATDIQKLYRGFFEHYSALYVDWLPTISYCIMILLHLFEYVFIVPKYLPDLFPVLWSIVGCGFCCLSYFITCWHLFAPHPTLSSSQDTSPNLLSYKKLS